MLTKNRKFEDRDREFEGLSSEDRRKIIRDRRMKEYEGLSCDEVDNLIRDRQVLTYCETACSLTCVTFMFLQRRQRLQR